MELVIETQHAERGASQDGDVGTRSLLGAPIREAIETTIFEGMPWPELKGKLFRFCLKEFGRCTSKVYIDVGRARESKPVGWVFERKEACEDAPGRTYIHEVWVMLRATVTCELGQKHLRSVCLDTGRVAS